VSAAALADLADRFARCVLPKAEWTHLAHLSVGAWHVHTFGAEAALARLRAGIRALNDQHGTANTATGGYHETITAAYVRLIDEFLMAFDARVPIHERVGLLVAGPLSDRSLLLRFWSRELLMSPAARADWVPPDLRPLGVPPEAMPAARSRLSP
jgi:hypothetical protein